MSKSKKNTVDPETMINQYGADAVRWFILSDSPPEKDVQWSEQGMLASFKFIQKFWNLNLELTNKINSKKDSNIKQLEKDITETVELIQERDQAYSDYIEQSGTKYSHVAPTRQQMNQSGGSGLLGGIGKLFGWKISTLYLYLLTYTTYLWKLLRAHTPSLESYGNSDGIKVSLNLVLHWKIT